MKCFYCLSENSNELITLSAQNDKELCICTTCLNVILRGKICCSYCGKEIEQHQTNSKVIEIKAKIGYNGIICTECEANGIKIHTKKTFVKTYNNLKSYSYKPTVSFNQLDNEDDKLYMGVELEIGGINNLRTVKNFCDEHGGNIFYFKCDASIRNYGCEIVSQPATLAYHESDESCWKQIFEDFNNLGFVSGSETNTGLHIHINRNILTAAQMKKIDLLVNMWKDFFYIIGRRQGNHYCSYRMKMHNEWGISYDRYQSVNFCNPYTVEFRFFNGTNKIEELFAALECVKTIVLLTENITYDDLYEHFANVETKIAQICKDNNFNNFLQFMYSKTGKKLWMK